MKTVTNISMVAMATIMIAGKPVSDKPNMSRLMRKGTLVMQLLSLQTCMCNHSAGPDLWLLKSEASTSSLYSVSEQQRLSQDCADV